MNNRARRVANLAGLPILAFVLWTIAVTFLGPISIRPQAASINTMKPVQVATADDGPALNVEQVQVIRKKPAGQKGDRAIIAFVSRGWQPGETVRVSIRRMGGSVPESARNLVADEMGRIKLTQLMLTNAEPGTRILSAKGRKSKRSIEKPFEIAVAETLTTLESTCTTPQTTFSLGNTVCARITGVDGDEPTGANFAWADPTGSVQQSGTLITTNNQTETFAIPASGGNARCGTWSVTEIDASAVEFASASFVVSGSGCPSVATFASDCTTPQTNFNPGDTVCAKVTIPAASSSQSFRFDFYDPSTLNTVGDTITMDGQTDSFVIPGGGPTGTWRAQISYASGGAQAVFTNFTVGGASCTLTCPADITTSSDVGFCGTSVTYTDPSGAGCGTVSCNPPSTSFFPVGTTTVTCTPATGTPCTFTITIIDDTPPTITCPANITVKTSSINSPCTIVNFPAPTASDNCGTPIVVCNLASGSCFPVGTVTVTCTATDVASNTATCSFMVTVFNVCLQDESNPKNVFLGNTLSGAYIFCCGGTVFTGTAKVIRQGNIATFEHNGPDRRLLARDDEGAFKGTASLQFPPGTIKCTIGDRDTRNNACACP